RLARRGSAGEDLVDLLLVHAVCADHEQAEDCFTELRIALHRTDLVAIGLKEDETVSRPLVAADLVGQPSIVPAPPAQDLGAGAVEQTADLGLTVSPVGHDRRVHEKHRFVRLYHRAPLCGQPDYSSSLALFLLTIEFVHG